MFDTIFGLPLHPLVVHATAVVVPTAALTVALAALWPPFRRWAGVLPFLISVAALVLVPISTASGESLERRVPHSALLQRHTQLGDQLLFPLLVLGIGAIGLLWVHLREQAHEAPTGRAATVLTRLGSAGRPGRPPGPVLVALALVALLGAAGTAVQVVRIGHSGAEAAWSDVATTTARPASGR